MQLFKCLLMLCGICVVFSCQQQTTTEVALNPGTITAKKVGPHAILFENFVNPRPFSPMVHYLEMNQKNATFHNNDTEITFEELKRLQEENVLVHIKTSGSTLNNPLVFVTMRPKNKATPEQNLGVKTDPAAVLEPYSSKKAVFFIGEKPTTIEEAKRILRTSQFPAQLFTAQIDDQLLMVIISNGC